MGITQSELVNFQEMDISFKLHHHSVGVILHIKVVVRSDQGGGGNLSRIMEGVTPLKAMVDVYLAFRY